ncbi:MAG TPA: EAL domain-containing protein [Candidatus Limnocylindria bacterium]|jgi:diguanylate cyclase (GGDEF)-like protein/PAS domain S-box-containing protein
MSREDRDLAAIYDAMACGVIVRDAAGAVVFANEAAKKIFGRPPEQLAGDQAAGGVRRIREDGTPMPDDEVPNIAAQQQGESIRNVMMGMVRADGYVRWLLVDAVPVKDAFGRVREVVSSFTDVTDRKKAELELERKTLYDPLTDLPNRILALDRLDQAIRTGLRFTTPVALLVMDLDRFKVVNDELGHAAGDQLLIEVATRLRADLRDQDTVARLGGDEFAIILPGSDEHGARRVAEKVTTALRRPFEIQNHAHEIGVSIGIAISPTHGDHVDAILRCADVAMYQAKRRASGVAVYSGAVELEGTDQLALVADLRRTLDRHELDVVYQPIVSLQTGTPIGVEALARWRHPERGLVDPARFIPLAERTGLVRPLFATVLEKTIAQAAVWRLDHVFLQASVNLSIGNLLDPELAVTVSDALRNAGAGPESLALEITESMLMADPERAMATLGSLQRLGVQLAIDDFGVGYSSLAYLQKLPAYAVKIDRTFVDRMTKDHGSAEIVKLIIQLGHSLGMTVTAEGVENRPTWEALSALHCDAAQGYFVARPMVGEAIASWMGRDHATKSDA